MLLLCIAIAVAGILGLLMTVIATRPDSFALERSTTIAAPAEAVFAFVDDFHLWTLWSPWEKRDPGLKRTYGGARRGTGAVYSWAGNKDVGAGRMTITDSVPNRRVGIRLEFIKPFAATSDAEFFLKPWGMETGVTWKVSGKKRFMSNAIFPVASMDKMIARDFERGLAAMKSVVEATAAQNQAAVRAALSSSPR